MKWVKLGDYIELYDKKNEDNIDYPVIGINKDKEFMPTVATLDGIDKKKYKIVKKGMFVFSGMQTGRDECIRIALYEDEKISIISPAYTTFTIKENNELLPEYVFMYFLRKEMDRYGWFISDSSVRSNLDWNRFIDIKIPLPSIDEQKKVVEVWKGLKNLKEQNDQLAQPLMDLCQSYLKDVKLRYQSTPIGPFIKRYDIRNKDNSIKIVKSVSVLKELNDTNAKVDKSELSSYKIVAPRQISFVQTTGNEKCLCAAMNQYNYPIVVTSVNEVFSVDENTLLPEYLMIIFKRKETDRYARFHSWGSARETFKWDDMCRFEIPLPPIEVQQAIVNIYNCAKEAKDIANKATQMINDICPALMQHIIGEAQ